MPADDLAQDYKARLYTFEDVRLVSMFARLEGAPDAEDIIRDLDAKSRLSKPEDDRAAA